MVAGPKLKKGDALLKKVECQVCANGCRRPTVDYVATFWSVRGPFGVIKMPKGAQVKGESV